ncbi:MAG: flagellar biosynthesis anti-sigma factor FlgM [Desulfatirhabdiaceae bacterium]
MVKIIDNPSSASLKVYTSRTAGVRKNSSDLNKSPSCGLGEDSVKLSSIARDIRDAMNILHQTPDIQEEKVAALKRRIESGEYVINSDTIADKIISEMLMNQIP